MSILIRCRGSFFFFFSERKRVYIVSDVYSIGIVGVGLYNPSLSSPSPCFITYLTFFLSSTSFKFLACRHGALWSFSIKSQNASVPYLSSPRAPASAIIGICALRPLLSVGNHVLSGTATASIPCYTLHWFLTLGFVFELQCSTSISVLSTDLQRHHQRKRAKYPSKKIRIHVILV